MTTLRSRDNPQVKRWARLAREGRFRRSEGRALIEGPHLLAALLARGLRPVALLATEEALEKAETRALVGQAKIAPTVLAQNIFDGIADAETPQGIAAEIEIPKAAQAKGDHVFLEGIQDAGNVGTILRTAAAFGVAAVVLDRACADPWSPKVLRAAAGGHFALAISQVPDLKAAVEQFKGQRICTTVKGGVDLRTVELSRPLGWIFGSEGGGVTPDLQKAASIRVTIPMERNSESLNVAAAAAICLYEEGRERT